MSQAETSEYGGRSHRVRAIGLAVLLGCLAGCGRKEPEPDIRHVILISLDTTRADHLGCYGHPMYKTPNIDAVAKEGLLFENHVTAAPTTLSAHTSLLTGCYSHTHGAARNGFFVNDDNRTLAEVLKERGFTTAAFIGCFALASVYNLNQGFDVYDEKLDYTVKKSASFERPAAAVTDAVLAWLKEREAERMFLFVHYFDPHSSYTPPPPYDRMYRNDSLPIQGSQLDLHNARQKIQKTGQRSIPEIDVLNRLYGGEISYTDEHVGRLIAGLRKTGILDRSLLIITGDHGETFAEHEELLGHGWEVFDTTVVPPLIIRFPNGAGGGRRIAGSVSNVDVMPTILEWLKIPGPEKMEGRSFGAVRGGGDVADRAVFSEATKPHSEDWEDDPIWRNQKKQKCLRSGRWKLIWHPAGGGYQLYDLQADPGEKVNLLVGGKAVEGAPVEEWKRQLEEWAARANPLASEWVESEEATEKLKAMGYAR